MDVRAVALNGVRRSCELILKDLEALPEDAFGKRFGPKTRSVADIIYEVNMVNDHVGLTMRGEELFPWPEGWITAPPEFATKEAVIAAFRTSSNRMIETVEAFSAEELEAPLVTDEGETTRFERCRFVTLHMWYHNGQINFIQTLLGDEEWHWF